MNDLYKTWLLLEQVQTQGLPLQPKFTLPDGVLVSLTNGSILRNTVDVDFVGGGHHYVYSYIPENEIWLENLAPSEQRFILVHEIVERLIMKYRKWDYDESHATANFVEAMFRHGHDMMEIFPWFIDAYIVPTEPAYKQLAAPIMQATLAYK